MKIPAGSTNVSVYYYIQQDASATSPGEPVTGLLFSDIETGGSASYMRQGAARVDLILITLASASAAHSDGGFILVDDTNMPGLYRCDYPDAAFVAGVDITLCQIVVASANNAVASPVMVELNTNADVVSWNGSALSGNGPFPELGIARRGTAQSATANGMVLDTGAAFADNTLIGATIGVFGSTQGYWQWKAIIDNTLSTDAVVVDTFVVTPSGVLTYVIFGTPPGSVTSPSPVNVTQLGGSATSLANLAASTLGIVAGAAVAGTLSSTQMSTNLTEVTNDQFINGLVVWTSGALAGSRSGITDYVGATKILTFNATQTGESPSADDTFVIV